ncbi:MAG: type II secretion system F family protein [Gammaproteobacteria bacterium]
MELFKYKAIDRAGKFVNGRSDALNPGDLEFRLTRLGLDLISFKQVQKNKGGSLLKQELKRADLITFCFHLEQLIRAGVPILEALGDLRDSVESSRLKEVIIAMIETIGGGKSLSEAMADFPNEFGAVFVHLIKAGEESGELVQVLEHITENLKWQDEQAANTKKLFIYPAFVLTIIIGVVFFLMLYLVPQLMQFMQNMGEELPFHTKLLISVSNFFTQFWYLFILIPLIIFAGVMFGLSSSTDFRRWFDGLKLKIPVFGPILKKMVMTRFTNYFAIMYASGITVIECVKSGETIVGNAAVASAIKDAGRLIADGEGISNAFEKTSLFPPLVLRMLRVGENTGTLEKSLQNVSYFYNREVKESVEQLQQMIGPALTVLIGILVGWIMFSILGPIYDLIAKIKI